MDHTVDDIDTMMEFIFPDKEINDTHNMLFLSALVTLQALVKYKGVRCTHSLIYTNTIQEAETVNEFVRLIIQHGLVDNIPAAIYHQALHSRITTDIETELKRFRQSEYGIVPCAYLLSEGFDMVELDAGHDRLANARTRSYCAVYLTTQPERCRESGKASHGDASDN